MRILVLNCYSRNALAVINSLDPSYELIGGASRKRHILCSPDRRFRSRRLQSVFRYAAPQSDPDGFRDDLIGAARSYRVDAIIATGTTCTDFLSQYKTEISSATGAKVLVEDYDKLSRMTDKWLTVQASRDADIPVPRTLLFDGEPKTLALLREFRFPIVVKPRRSFASIGITFFASEAEWDRHMKESGETYVVPSGGEPAFIVQEVVDGDLHDVTLCADKGRAISILSQERLLCARDFGGGGIVNRTTDEPTIRDYAERLVHLMEWNGIAEFDFIKSSDGSYCLLECNPKIWGTTQLTIEAGLNVVQQLVDVFVLGKHVEKCKGYEVGLVYKWIFPECIQSWSKAPRTIRSILKRVAATFRRYDAVRSMSNLERRNGLHFLGMALDALRRRGQE